MDELTAAGQPHVGGTRPFGYRRVTDAHGSPARPVAYEIVDDEAALIRAAVDAILDDGRSVRSIALDWRARGIVAPSGKPWQPGPLQRMLTSAQLAGLRERRVDRDPKLRPPVGRGGDYARHLARDPARDRWQALRAILSDPERRTTPAMPASTC